MTHRFADVIDTDSAKAAQKYYGSRAHNNWLQTIAVLGARIIKTTVNEMKRFDIQYDQVSVCVAGAVGNRMLLERS